MNEEAIFSAALALASHAQRGAFLDQACANDIGLRRRVDALLQAHENPDSFLEAPGSAVEPTRDEPPSDRPGTVIGLYKLLEQVGEGGFGVVFMAEQQRPVCRKVALKVLKPGMDTRQVIARFEAERQALALMDHPNIARVFDGGETAGGRPYFVMELVKGIPITEYCDQSQLTPRERLELIIPVCQAVQHAHQKGIIHRDLKPSNVLVTLHDGTPVVKVIDFGIAKALGQRLTDKTLYTGFGQMIGTPLYMSPEQAVLSGLDVDTRTDIYALGVLLYELLTGTTPFDKERLGQVDYDELRHIICHEEPPKPSTRISTLGQAATTVSTQRRSDPKRLSQLFRGELDWIVMKALEKDRNRRYETASAFAADVQRYLRDEPVEARPASTGYRLRKLLRRNKGPVITAAVICLLLLGGIIGTTLGLVRADQARQAEANRAEAEGRAKELAESRLGQIEKANDILGSIFKNLNPNAEEQGGPALRVQLGEQLDKAATLLQGQAVGDPLTVARLQDVLGRSLRALGHYEKAQPLLEKARQTRETLLGPEHPDTLWSKSDLGELYQAQGDYDRAESLYREVLQAATAKLDADHPDTLKSKSGLASLYVDQGKYDRAEPLFQELLETLTAKLGADHADILGTKLNLGLLYMKQGNYDRAELLYHGVLQAATVKLGADHPTTLCSKLNLGLLYRKQAKYDRAELLYQEVLQAATAKLGADHPNTLASKNNLASLYQAQGKYDRAEPLLREVLQAATAKLGADHPNTLTGKNNLAQLYQAHGKYNLAEPLFQELLQVRTAKLGADHPDTLKGKNNLAAVYAAQGKYDRAEPLYQEVLQARSAKLGPDHPDNLNSKHSLGCLYLAQGRYERAEPLLREAVAGARRKLTLAHPRTQDYMRNLTDFYQRIGQPAKAEPLCHELAEFCKQQAGADSPQYAAQLAALGTNLLAQTKCAEAELVLRDCLAIRVKKEPDVWTTFNTKSLLGGALAGQKKYGEAEPLLLQGYYGIKQVEAKIPKQWKGLRLAEALERLVLLYDGWNNKEKAAEWRTKLEAQRDAEKKTDKPKQK